MADEADISSEKQQLMEERKLAEVRAKADVLEVEASDHCLWCGEDVAPPKRWCGPDCRDMWEMYAK